MLRKKIVSLRKERKLTQSDVAMAIEISRAHYGRIETGDRNPSFATAMKIKKYFDYSNDDIFDNTNSN